MFNDWCEIDDPGAHEKKRLCCLEELEGGRAVVLPLLARRVRAHYDDLECIAADINDLGFAGAAAILRERLPRTRTARSGELGEILATEFIEFSTDFRVPVRRLRYKDGREMALRGDDFLGVCTDNAGQVLLLKGEAKSRRRLAAGVLAEARSALSNNDGRPTPISLLFIADRLLEAGGEAEALGRSLRQEVARRAVERGRITHALFTLSGNAAQAFAAEDMAAADNEHPHFTTCMLIADHGDFIAEVYERAADLGDN